jgi:hypothetical protein
VAVGTAGLGIQQALRETDEDKQKRILRESQRREAVDTRMPTPISEEERDFRTAGDRATALRNAKQGYEDKKWRGSGLLGTPFAMLMNRKGKKGIADDADKRYQSLVQTREANQMKTDRLSRDKARGTILDQEFDTEQQGRVFGQESSMYERERTDELADAKAERDRAPQLAEQQAAAESTQAYRAAREMQNVEYMKESRKTAGTAIKNNRSLSRMFAASKDGREGGAADILSKIQNMFVSFGVPADGLEDVATMQQAVGAIKAEYMSELGARGLTDKDMEILSVALPRMETSREAREKVITILKKENNLKIFGYLDQVADEEERYPGVKVNRPSWYKSAVNSNAYGAYKEKQRRDQEKEWQ